MQYKVLRHPFYTLTEAKLKLHIKIAVRKPTVILLLHWKQPVLLGRGGTTQAEHQGASKELCWEDFFIFLGRFAIEQGLLLPYLQHFWVSFILLLLITHCSPLSTFRSPSKTQIQAFCAALILKHCSFLPSNKMHRGNSKNRQETAQPFSFQTCIRAPN